MYYVRYMYEIVYEYNDYSVMYFLFKQYIHKNSTYLTVIYLDAPKCSLTHEIIFILVQF